ncbi:MAG: L-threonylcarbamoyladenylate synthase [Flavobacteriaceae bacterium]|nr:L-threonylcarbamoyladenylate synthase [Flavobacteriaceae bacterium]
MADFINVYSETPNPKDLLRVIKILNKGGVIIFPTDTVYGLGCLSNNLSALDRFAKIKGLRIEQAPFSFLFQDIRSLSNYVAPMNSKTFKLVKRLLPGPYALIMNAAQKLPKPFQKRKTIGVRISNHPVLQSLLPLLEVPLITSSLHDPDEILDYTTDPENLFEQWESKIDLMLSDGYGNNIPSTVLDLSTDPFEIIREGAGEIPF